MQNLTQLFPYLAALGISMFVGGYAWSRKSRPEAKALAFLVLSQVLWAIGFLLETQAETLAGKILLDYIQYFPSAAWPFCFLYFCVVYANVHFKRAFLFLIPVPIGPVFVVAFVVSERWHNLLYDDATIVDGHLHYTFPGLIHFGFAILVLLLFIGVAFLFSGIRRAAPLFRRQQLIVLGGSLVPVAGIVLSVADIRIAGHRDTSIFTFAISNLVVAYSLFKEHLLEVVPVARDKIVDAMHDFAVVISYDGAVLDINLPAQKLLDVSGSRWIGKKYQQVFITWPELVDGVSDSLGEDKCADVVAHKNGRSYELSQNALLTRGRQSGYVFIGHDITAALEQESVLEESVRARTEDLIVANNEDINFKNNSKTFSASCPLFWWVSIRIIG